MLYNYKQTVTPVARFREPHMNAIACKRRFRREISALAVAMILSTPLTAHAWADAFERLKVERLRVVHRDIKAFESQRQEVPRLDSYRDYRANLHVHSAFSHDSRGQIDDIVAAAKAVGTQVLMFTEHPAAAYDFFKDGHQGFRDGVLLIPGAEMQGFLVFPTHSLKGLDGGTPQEFSDLVRGREGLIFLSHLEERMDWRIQGLTGCEIYNTHADFKDETKLIEALKNPLWLINSADAFRKYPQEAFSALLDYPADYLRRWDQLCELAPHTGISANDAHQNVGIVIRLVEGKQARIEDALGEKILEIDAAANPAFLPFLKNKQVGDVLFELRLDRYEHSLRHVATHLLMKELTNEAVRDALESGRAYVAFDWIANPTGFDFSVVSDTARHVMGSQAPFAKGLMMRGQSPLSVGWKLIRNGKVSSESIGQTLDVAVTEPGNYRVEAWLRVGGRQVPWILSNPIYVHP